jgi:hypothetical protein
MTMSTELARLDDLIVTEHDRSTESWPEYSAVILAPVPNVPSNWAPVEHLTDYEPAQVRAFGEALLRVAERMESIRDDQ